MSIVRAENVIKDVCEKLGGEQLARAIDYHPEKIQVSAQNVKCFCPLHDEKAFRSLVLDEKKKTFRCTMKRCIGFEGGSFVELWAYHHRIEPLEAALDLAEKLNLDIDVGALRNLGRDVLDRARTALNKGDLKTAREEADQALGFLPADFEVGMLSAQIYRASGESERAEVEFLKLVDACIAAGELDKAETTLRPLREENASSSELLRREVDLARARADARGLKCALLALATAFVKQGNEGEELAALAELEQLTTDDPTARLKVAKIHEKRGRIPEAVRLLGEAATGYRQAGDMTAYCRVLAQCEGHDPENLELREDLAKGLVEIGEKQPATRKFLELGKAYRSHGNVDRAIELTKLALQASPDHRIALEALAALYAEAGRENEGVPCYLRLASLAREKKDPQTALGYLEKALALDPEDLGLRRELAEHHLAEGRTEQGIDELLEVAELLMSESETNNAVEVLERVGELVRDDHAMLLRIGTTLENAGLEDEALAHYRKHAERFREQGKHEPALVLCEAIARISPQDSALLDLRVDLSLKLGRRDAALAACRDAGKAFVQAGDFEQSEKVLRKGAKIDLTDPEIRADLARVLEKSGKKSEALELWIEVALFLRASEDSDRCLLAAREALRIAPDNSEAQGIVAEELEKQGKVNEALQLWKSIASDLIERDADADEALKVLNHALELAPTNLELLRSAARLKLRHLDAKDVRASFASWLKQTEAARDSEAEFEALQEAVDAFPDEWDWARRLADAYAERGMNAKSIGLLESMLERLDGAGDTDPRYIETLERIVRIAPDRLDRKVQWADALASAGQTQQASVILLEIARHWLGQGEKEQGLHTLERLLGHTPDDPDLLEQIADLHLNLGRNEEAVSTFTRLADLYGTQGRSAERAKILEQILSLQPERLDFREELAVYFEEQGDIEQAVEHYFELTRTRVEEAPKADATLELCRNLVRLAPDFREARETLISCHLERSEIADAKQELETLGEGALREGDLDAAEVTFVRIKAIAPEDFRNEERLGKLHEARGDIEPAIECYRKVLQILETAGQKEAALELLGKLRRLAPDDLELRHRFARSLAEDGANSDEAAREFFDLITLAVVEDLSTSALSMWEEAKHLFADRWDDRLELGASLADAAGDEGGVRLWCELARDARASRKWEVARQATDEGLLLVPDHRETRELRAEVCLELEDRETAESDFRLLADQMIEDRNQGEAERFILRALELSQSDTELLNQLVECQLAQDHEDDAIASLRALVPIYRESGAWDAAIGRTRRICELSPGTPAAQGELAEILLLSGDEDAAIEVYGGTAEELCAKDDVDGAIAWLEKILDLRAEDLPTLKRRAELTYQTGRKEDALDLYRGLLDVVIAGGDAEASGEIFNDVLEKYPKELELSERFAFFVYEDCEIERGEELIIKSASGCAADGGDAMRGVAVLDRLLASDGACVPALEAKATLLLDSKRNDEAGLTLELLSQVHSDNGDDEEAAECRGRRAHVLAEDPEAQLHAARSFCDVDRQSQAVAFFRKAAELFHRQGNAGEAVSTLEEALEHNPEDLTVLRLLARAYEANADPAAASMCWLTVGELCESSDDFVEARKVYEHLKKTDQGNIDARRRLAIIAEKEGNTELALGEWKDVYRLQRTSGDEGAATQTLEAILSVRPDDEFALASLADVYRSTGETDRLTDVLRSLDRVYTKGGDEEGALRVLGELYDLRPDDFELAHKYFNVLVALKKPDLAMEHGLRVVTVFYESNEVDSAATFSNTVIEIAPRDVDLRITLAKLAQKFLHDSVAVSGLVRGAEELWEADQGKLAFALCDEAKALYPEETHLRQALITTLQRLDDAERAVAEQMSLAELFEAQDNDQRALDVYLEVLATEPRNEDAYESLINISLKRGENDTVVEYVTQLAEIRYEDGNLEQSIASLERLAELDIQKLELELRLAELYIEADRAEDAERVFSMVAERHREQGDLDTAVMVYERARKIFPTSSEILTSLAECYEQTGNRESYLEVGLVLGGIYLEAADHPKAVNLIERVVSYHPANINALTMLGRAYEASDRPKDAAQCHQSISERHEQARRLEEARASLQRASDLAELGADARERLGHLCIKTGQKADGTAHLRAAAAQCRKEDNPQGAADLFEALLKSDPGNLEMRSELASIYESCGENEAAVRHYAQAARRAFDQKRFEQARDIYERLLRLSPESIKERESLARVLDTLGHRDEALAQYMKIVEGLDGKDDSRQKIRFCRQILKLDADHCGAHEQLYRAYRDSGKQRLAHLETQWLTEHYQQTGRLDEAEAILREALEAAPENIELLRRLTELFLSNDRTGDASEVLNRVATIAGRKGDAKTADWAVRKACEINPTDVEAHGNLAALHDREDEPEKAKVVRFRMVELHLQRGETKEAQALAERVANAATGDLTVRQGFADAFAAAGLPEVATYHLAEMAKLALDAGDLEKVVEVTDRLLSHNPRHVRSLELSIEALLGLGKTLGAIDQGRTLFDICRSKHEPEACATHLKLILEHAPSDPEPRVWITEMLRASQDHEPLCDQLRSLAEIYCNRSNLDAAIAALREILQIQPDDIGARERYIDLYSQIHDESDLQDDYVALGAAYEKIGETEKATDIFQRMVQHYPDNTDCRLRLIEFLFNGGQTDEAISASKDLAGQHLERGEKVEASKVLDRALKAAPDSTDLRFQLAKLQIQTNRRGLALETLGELLTHYEKKGDREECVEILRMILGLDPSDTDLRLQLADLYARLDNVDEAKTQRVTLAEQFHERRLFDLAEREYRRALDISPDDIQIWYRVIETHKEIGPQAEIVPDMKALAKLLKEQGRSQEAADMYREVLDIEPDNLELLSAYLSVAREVQPEEELVDDYLRMATLLSQGGEIAQAVGIYERLRQIAPEDRRVERGLKEAGDSKTEERPSEAGDTSVRATHADSSTDAAAPKARKSPRKTGGKLSKTDRLNKEIKNFENILKLNPENPSVRARLARLFAKVGRNDEADRHWATAAQDFFARGELEKCIDIYEDLVPRQPGDSHLRERLSRAKLRRESLHAIDSVIEEVDDAAA